MAPKVIILEVNEVPLRVFRRFAEHQPGSAVARLLADGAVAESVAGDVTVEFLYPSQTWASLNTGVPYDQHRIHWYNDPKPDAYPLYWRKLAASGHSVGLVNSLHAAPLDALCDDDAIRFLIPDCFVEDSRVKPGYYEAFQRLNLRASAESARVSTLRPPLRELASCAISLPRLGLRPRTVATSVSTVAGILAKRVNRERVRSLQFLPLADFFQRLTATHDPDLAILFTNHVAANMHRYWYALFPEDYSERIYDDDWVQRYRREILDAMALLDNVVAELMAFVKRTDRVLVVTSSMGQCANPHLTRAQRIAQSRDHRLEDVAALVSVLSPKRWSYRIAQAMVPQYTLAFESVDDAAAFGAEAAAAGSRAKNLWLKVDVNELTVTLSANAQADGSPIELDGRQYAPEEVGFKSLPVEDHHSGHHYPYGSLIVYNSRSARFPEPQVDYLEYAPAVLRHFGVTPPSYMREPSIRI